MKRIYRLAIVIFLLATTVGCDQTTKVIAKDQLADSPPIFLLGDAILFVYTHNTGAILSLGAQLSAEARFLLFVVFTSAILVALLVFVIRAHQLSLFQLVGLSLIAGGGVGNLIDRILYNGSVVDFMRLKIGFLQTGIFNLADVAIFTGIFLLLLSNLPMKWHQARHT